MAPCLQPQELLLIQLLLGIGVHSNVLTGHKGKASAPAMSYTNATKMVETSCYLQVGPLHTRLAEVALGELVMESWWFPEECNQHVHPPPCHVVLQATLGP